ncbi:hypothetical protein [uncultured Draconibacterium sp.]|uniref:hypothetical protein n=1 Tax=uncultured Draconibacterium sp. TaxID=1573823 RepID=UPI003217510C
MKTKILLLTLGILYAFLGEAQSQNKPKRNAAEVSVYTINTTNFQFAKDFHPEFGYSRYIGNYVKVGAFYRYLKQTNTYQDYIVKAGFLPLPLFIKNENFNNNWEFDLNFCYKYYVQSGDSENGNWSLKQHKVFAQMGASRKIKNNLYGIASIDFWNENAVFLGIRYKF